MRHINYNWFDWLGVFLAGIVAIIAIFLAATAIKALIDTNGFTSVLQKIQEIWRISPAQ